jgi:hypothetical protein
MQKEYCEHIWCVYCSLVQKGDTLGVDPSVVLNVDTLSRLSTVDSQLWTLAFSTLNCGLSPSRLSTVDSRLLDSQLWTLAFSTLAFSTLNCGLSPSLGA